MAANVAEHEALLKCSRASTKTSLGPPKSRPPPNYALCAGRCQHGAAARHGFVSSNSESERIALNAKRQAKQLRAWQGLERRLTARRNLALKKLSNIRAMVM